MNNQEAENAEAEARTTAEAKDAVDKALRGYLPIKVTVHKKQARKTATAIDTQGLDLSARKKIADEQARKLVEEATRRW